MNTEKLFRLKLHLTVAFVHNKLVTGSRNVADHKQFVCLSSIQDEKKKEYFMSDVVGSFCHQSERLLE